MMGCAAKQSAANESSKAIFSTLLIVQLNYWLMAEPEVRIAAGDRGFEERVQRLADRVHSRFRYHSIDLPDGSVLPGLQGRWFTFRWRLDLFQLAAGPARQARASTSGRGGMDGSASNANARGASASQDCVALDTFNEARELIGSKVEYLTLDVNELSARRLGTFDIVLFFGVLYHLRHPLLGLEKAARRSHGPDAD